VKVLLKRIHLNDDDDDDDNDDDEDEDDDDDDDDEGLHPQTQKLEAR